MVTGLLSLSICAVWLVIIIAAYLAIYRQAQRRGRLVMRLGAAIVFLLIVALIIGPSVQARLTLLAYPPQPSPSSALLGVAWSDSQGRLRLVGVSARDGSTRWNDSLTASYITNAAAGDGAIYVADYTSITAVRASDGARLWQLTQAVVGNSSLVFHSGLLIFLAHAPGVSPYQYSLDALDVTTRTMKWRVPLPDYTENNTQPAFALGPDLAFVSSNAGTARAYRLSDGSLAWAHQLQQGTIPHQIWMQADERQVYVYDARGALIALRQTDGALTWSRPTTVYLSEGQALSATGAGLYACGALPSGAGSALLSLDPASGAIRWEHANTCFLSGAIEADGVLYQSGQAVTALRVSDGATLWRASTGTGDLGFVSMRLDQGVVVAIASVIFPRALNTCANWWSSGALFCHSQTFIAAFNSATGVRYWQVYVGEYPQLLSSASVA